MIYPSIYSTKFKNTNHSYLNIIIKSSTPTCMFVYIILICKINNYDNKKIILR